MSDTNVKIENWNFGCHSLLADEKIPAGASSDENNWLSFEDRIELIRGKYLIGARESGIGKVRGFHAAYKTDGTSVWFRKQGTKIQYFNIVTNLWVDVITVTADAEYTFANYFSLAGSFVYICGVDGLYKICTANPGSYLSMYNAAINYKGKIMITTARMYLWDRAEDRTGLYLSYIDEANYTTITAEVLDPSGQTTYTGWLAAKGVKASGTLTSTGVIPTDGDTITIGTGATTRTYIFKTVLTVPGTIPYEVLIDGSAAAALDNLKLAINLGAGIGNKYSTGTLIHPTVEATVNTDTTQDVRAKIAGTAGNAIITTEMAATLSWGGGVLAGGSENLIRSVFGIVLRGTTGAGIETFADDFNGVLTGSLGGTGTINYATGQYSVTFNGVVTAGNVEVDYQWENSNDGGVTDFTFSSPRLAGEGCIFRQDDGGDRIMNVLLFDNKIYSIKARSVYELELTADDTNAVNLIFRKDIGMKFFRSAVATSLGIIFMDTANPDKPKLTQLQRNITGDNLIPVELASQFKFANYSWDECAMETLGEYIVMTAMDGENSETILLFNNRLKTIDIVKYTASCFMKDGGILYAGDSITNNTFQLFSGFDDDGYEIKNYWIGRNERYDTEDLKKLKKLTFRGLIGRSQTVEIYMSIDNDSFELVGTIEGDADYVDETERHVIGANMIGVDEIGGGGEGSVIAYRYFMEIKLQKNRFHTRKIKFVATGIEYVSIEFQMDKDIRFDGWANKLPKKYRI